MKICEKKGGRGVVSVQLPAFSSQVKSTSNVALIVVINDGLTDSIESPRNSIRPFQTADSNIGYIIIAIT